jgi:hypothetical protein
MIKTRFPFNLPWVLTDPGQLEMSLLNLMVNARDAMPEGGPVILAARRETVTANDGKLAPGPYVCLSVTDTGEGMDEATLARHGAFLYNQGDREGHWLGTADGARDGRRIGRPVHSAAGMRTARRAASPFRSKNRREICAMLERLAGNVKTAAAVFMTDDSRATEAHFARVRAGRVESVETSA